MYCIALHLLLNFFSFFCFFVCLFVCLFVCVFVFLLSQLTYWSHFILFCLSFPFSSSFLFIFLLIYFLYIGYCTEWRCENFWKNEIFYDLIWNWRNSSRKEKLWWTLWGTYIISYLHFISSWLKVRSGIWLYSNCIIIDDTWEFMLHKNWYYLRINTSWKLIMYNKT